jgi:septum formation protein
MDHFLNKKIILASKSPRRQHLLKEILSDFEIRTKDTDESFSNALVREQIPLFLCEHKALAFSNEIKENEILITADTIVWVQNKVLNKPESNSEAVNMLQLLSGKMHEVITGVCISSLQKKISFHNITKVYFKPLSGREIDYYVQTYKPFDKAGSYGIQEWIGYIGIEKIEGSYFNVMGFPIKEVYENLISFVCD